MDFLAQLDAAALAAAKDDTTLIVLAIVGSTTTVVVSIVSAIVSVMNSRKLSKVENMPQELQRLEIKLDGRLQELMDSKEKAAYSAGGEKERSEERDRQGHTAIGAHRSESDPPQKVEVVTPSGPVDVKVAAPVKIEKDE